MLHDHKAMALQSSCLVGHRGGGIIPSELLFSRYFFHRPLMMYLQDDSKTDYERSDMGKRYQKKFPPSALTVKAKMSLNT